MFESALPTRIVLAGMSGFLREIVSLALAAEPDLTVVAALVADDSLIAAVDLHRADVVVLGADHLPISQVGQALLNERPRVVVLTLGDGGRDAAVSRLVGDAAADELVRAIRCARTAS